MSLVRRFASWRILVQRTDGDGVEIMAEFVGGLFDGARLQEPQVELEDPATGKLVLTFTNNVGAGFMPEAITLERDGKRYRYELHVTTRYIDLEPGKFMQDVFEDDDFHEYRLVQ